jgi:methyl acetate hydrolase
MMLNDGVGANGQVLRAETVSRMSQDGLGALQATGWKSSIPSLSNDGEFFPGVDKGWAYSFMTNREQTPSGRPAGSLMWAGLANSFFWIDRQQGIGGYWASQILPFQDCASYPGFVDFETAVNHHLQR